MTPGSIIRPPIWVTSYPTFSGIRGQDESWENWEDMMRAYQEANDSKGLPVSNFWMVLGVSAKGFSEEIEWHPEIPMLMPTSGSGEFVGIARTKDELDQLLQDDKKHVHLTYRVKLQGPKAWRDLIEFMALHNMLEKESI